MAQKTKAKRSKRGMGTLYKRGKKGEYIPAGADSQGNYWLKFNDDRFPLVDDAGKSITTLKEAEQARMKIVAPLIGADKKEKLEIIKAKIESASNDAEQAKRNNTPALTLANAWSEYKKSQNRPTSGKMTLKRYESCQNAFNKWMKENYSTVKEMRAVETEHAEGYAHQLEENNVSPSTFNIYMNNLCMIWRVLEKKASLTQNPFAWDDSTMTGIKRKNIKAQAGLRKKRALTLEEVNTVIDKAEGDYRTLFIILACSGQRLVDCVKLKWSEIDFNTNTITLVPQKTARRNGKTVYIPIIAQLRQELESIIRNGKYVLPDLVTLYNKDQAIITKGIRAVFDAADLTAHKDTDLEIGKAIVETGAHSFRHSFVTIARMSGFPDPLIMKITGHSSEDMIDHYTDINEKMVAVLAAKLPHSIANSSAGFIPQDTKQPIPEWAVEKLKEASDDNWKSIIGDLLNNR